MFLLSNFFFKGIRHCVYTFKPPLQAPSLSVNRKFMLVGTLFNLLCDFYGCFLYLLFIKLCQAFIFFSSKKIKMDLALSVYPSTLEKNVKIQNKSTENRFVFVVAVHLLSCVQLFSTPWTVVHQAFLSFAASQSLLKLTSIELVMLFNHLILSLCSIRIFSSELALCIRWPKYWSFSFSISSSNEYSGIPMDIQKLVIDELKIQ